MFKRPSLLFLLLPLLFFSCSKSNEPKEVSIKTYTSDQLNYPENPLPISQTAREEFISKTFNPWTASPEELLSELESHPGKSTKYLEKYLEDDSWFGENKKAHTE